MLRFILIGFTFLFATSTLAEESTPLSDSLTALWEGWSQAAEFTKEELDAIIANESNNILVQTSAYVSAGIITSTRKNLQEAWRGEPINQSEALQLCLAGHYFIQTNEAEIRALWHFIQAQELLEQDDSLRFIAGRFVSFSSAPHTIRRYDAAYDNPDLLGDYLTTDKLPSCGTFFANGSGLARALFSDTGRAALSQSGFSLMLALVKERQGNNPEAEDLWQWLISLRSDT